jgi:hypothetical protein
MTRFLCGESLGGRELEPDPLGLGFPTTGVGDGRSSRVVGVPSRPLIVRSVMHQINGSSADDPPPPPLFVAGTLVASCSWLVPGIHQLDTAAVNGVMPFGGPVKHPRSTDPIFGV